MNLTESELRSNPRLNCQAPVLNCFNCGTAHRQKKDSHNAQQKSLIYCALHHIYLNIRQGLSPNTSLLQGGDGQHIIIKHTIKHVQASSRNWWLMGLSYLQLNMIPVEVGFRHLAFKKEIKHVKYINQLFLCIPKGHTGGKRSSSLTRVLSTRWKWAVSYIPWPLFILRINPLVTHWIGGWMGPRVDILEMKNISLAPTGIRAPDHPAHSIATTPTAVCTYHDTYIHTHTHTHTIQAYKWIKISITKFIYMKSLP